MDDRNNTIAGWVLGAGIVALGAWLVTGEAFKGDSHAKGGWELADAKGIAVTRMAQAFAPPQGTITSVRVAGILARQRKPGDSGDLRCERWEVVLAEVEYLVG